MIIADFTNCAEDTVTASGVLYQYDYNQDLKIQGLNIAGSAQVHFSFQQSFGEAVRVIGEAEDGDLTVQIPNFLLKRFLSCQGEYYIWAFVYVVNSDAGETIKRIRIRVIARPRPKDYSEPEYKDAFDQLTESLAAKLDKNQGAENDGKFLAVGDDGNITLVDGNGGGSGGGGTVSVQVASTTTGEPGTDAKVTNSGDSQNVKLNFVIPRGNPGAKGDTGATPNLTIGTVQTLEPDQNATASMSGTPENPLLNLGIPKGGGSVDPEQIKQAVNGYLEENPVSGMTAEQEQQLNQNTTDVADLKSALEQKGLPAGGTLGQVLVKKSDENYDAEWENISVGTSDQYFEMVSSGSSTTNGVSLDISGILSNPPTLGEWDGLQNWYQMSYRADSIPAQNGLPVEKLISKPIKGIPYFRAFTDSGSRYSTSNAIAFYGCNSDKAIEEEGNQCSLCEKKFVYTPVDQLPNGTSDAGVIVAYPQEKFDYYYIKLDTAFYSSSNTGKYNRLNPTHISAFDSSVLDNPLIEIGTNTEEFLRMKDEYLDGYYKNMFSHDKFKEIFKNYYAQMAPKIGIYQTCGKAIYIGGDSLHDYAGGDGVSDPGFVTTWNQYLGFSVVKNDGYAGSTWSETTGGGGLKRAKDLISSGIVYDVIILAWGTNDDTGGDGTIDDVASDTEGATMVAAMKWIITNLRNTFKNTAIGVIIPPPKNAEDGMKVRGDLMVQVCELLHVPYVDMREYISISDLGSDHIHLGTGAGKYGAAEASLILRICPYGDTLYPGKTD